MRAVVQRVQWARVTVEGDVVGQCGPGLMILIAAHREDTEAIAAKMADRVYGMRIFEDEGGKMNLALKDLPPTGLPQVLAISQFTLYGDTKSRRPGFTESAPFELGKKYYDCFVDELRKLGLDTQTGIFGADMKVELLNDGPVTLIVDIP